MVRQRNRLNALMVKNLKKPGRYADGACLYLHIRSNGSKCWVFRYRDRTTGKLRDHGLGPYDDVDLAEARDAASDCRKMLRNGIDPIDAKKADKQAALLERAKQVTFQACVNGYLEAHRAGWRNTKHTQQWENTLNTYAAKLMSLSVSRIDTGLVLQCLEPIWTTKTETATRVRQRIETVIDWATARKFRQGENPARWRGHLDKLLPKPSKVKKVKHRAALPYVEIGAFLKELGDVGGTASRALEFQILTAVRPGEAVNARWDEIDLKAMSWTIPAEKMKAEKEHTVPLSDRAINLLKSLPKNSDYVFPGNSSSNSLTTAAGMKILKGLKPGLTQHGFRSTFRDWAADQTAYPREVIENALAHRLKDKAEAAYFRSDQFPKRKRLMQDWANYCSQVPADSDVVPIRRGELNKGETKRQNPV